MLVNSGRGAFGVLCGCLTVGRGWRAVAVEEGPTGCRLAGKTADAHGKGWTCMWLGVCPGPLNLFTKLVSCAHTLLMAAHLVADFSLDLSRRASALRSLPLSSITTLGHRDHKARQEARHGRQGMKAIRRKGCGCFRERCP